MISTKTIDDVMPQQTSGGRAKTKFCVRILQLLQETLKDRKKITEYGIGWCDDGKHFICNTQILGQYLKLKANSINTNFRAHCFQIKNTTPEEIKKSFGNLPELKNWKLRLNVKHPFNSACTENDVENIPCVEKSRQMLDLVEESNSLFPQSTLKLLKNDNCSLHQIEILLDPVKFSPNWKYSYLCQTTDDWIKIAGNSKTISPTDLIKSIISSSQPKVTHDQYIILERNLEHFLKYSFCNSQSANSTFIDYLKLSLRFGYLPNIAQTVLELSTDNDFSNSSSFARWFIPSTDFAYAADILNRNSLDWVIKLSGSVPNQFSILKKSKNQIISSNIIFNPKPITPEQRLSIKDDDEHCLNGEKWESFLVNVLNLQMPHSNFSVIPNNSVRHVQARDIIQSNEEMHYAHYETSDGSFDLFGSQNRPDFPSLFNGSQTVHSGMTPDLFGSQTISDGLPPECGF